MSQNYSVLSNESEKTAFCIVKQTIDEYMTTGKQFEPNLEQLPPEFKKNRGVFITLYLKNAKGEENLRGCVGLPRPVFPLGIAIAKATFSSLCSDPRFLPVSAEEVPDLTIELEVLSEMEKIEYQSVEELIDQIEVGKDGLMVESPPYSGLLLPVVPLKYNWDAEQFVYALCQKANMPFHLLSDEQTIVYKFQAQVFKREITELEEICES
ncbi:MAG: TIGR00296 family protein [Methanobacteriota archaeon]|nr:MAG: TIGR00296 family protein [Euryarchaeota archaeon]